MNVINLEKKTHESVNLQKQRKRKPHFLKFERRASRPMQMSSTLQGQWTLAVESSSSSWTSRHTQPPLSVYPPLPLLLLLLRSTSSPKTLIQKSIFVWFVISCCFRFASIYIWNPQLSWFPIDIEIKLAQPERFLCCASLFWVKCRTGVRERDVYGFCGEYSVADKRRVIGDCEDSDVYFIYL